jgi:hypothetical protein
MPITDYESEQDRIKRMFAEAMALRQDSDQPHGRMVGKWYVAPSWSEQLAPVVNQVMGGYKSHKAEEASKELGSRIQGDYGDWMKRRPQAQVTQTSEEIPGTEAPGPLQEGQFGPLQKTRMVKQVTEPTRDQQIDWAGQGLKNPLSKALAASYLEDQLIKAPERDEAREFKAHESELQRIALNQRQAENLKSKLDMLNIEMGRKDITEANRMVIAKMQDATKRELGFAEAKARVDAAALKAKAAGEKVTPVPNNVTTKMSEAEQNADGLTSAFTTYKPEFGGYKGALSAMAGRLSPFTTEGMDEAAAWWNNYEGQAALVKRHSLFGSAFTPGEQAAWDKATIRPTDNPQLIATNLKIRAELANKFYNKLRNQYVITGHGAIGEAFPERPETFEQIPGSVAAPVTPLVPQKRVTPNRRKNDLPPGVTIEPE